MNRPRRRISPVLRSRRTLFYQERDWQFQEAKRIIAGPDPFVEHIKQLIPHWTNSNSESEYATMSAKGD